MPEPAPMQTIGTAGLVGRWKDGQLRTKHGMKSPTLASSRYAELNPRRLA